MREFVKGWRRKAGCVTLVMALAFTCLWVRTNVIVDRVHFTIGDRRHTIFSGLGGIIWEGYDDSRKGGRRINWFTDDIYQFNASYYPQVELRNRRARLNLLRPRKLESWESSSRDADGKRA